jgi:alkylated DNA repair dioxygenase AlkB
MLGLEVMANQVAAEVSGLRYIAGYLTPDEQSRLAAIVDQQLWLTDLKRRVQHYGYRYDYVQRKVDPSMFLGPLPEWAVSLAKRLQRDGYVVETPDQLIVNEYRPGQGISSHIDCEPCFGDTIISISLGSPCVMVFTHSRSRVQIPVLLEPGSLAVMQGDARHLWLHGIPPRKTDVVDGRKIERSRRLSLTFRNVVLANN